MIKSIADHGEEGVEDALNVNLLKINNLDDVIQQKVHEAEMLLA